MTRSHTTTFLLPLLLLLLFATAAANRPPLANFKRGPETPQSDFVPPEPEREESIQSVLQQVAQGVFPASLWAAMPRWHPVPQVSPDILDIYTTKQVSRFLARNRYSPVQR